MWQVGPAVVGDSITPRPDWEKSDWLHGRAGNIRGAALANGGKTDGRRTDVDIFDKLPSHTVDNLKGGAPKPEKVRRVVLTGGGKFDGRRAH